MVRGAAPKACSTHTLAKTRSHTHPPRKIAVLDQQKEVTAVQLVVSMHPDDFAVIERSAQLQNKDMVDLVVLASFQCSRDYLEIHDPVWLKNLGDASYSKTTSDA